MATTPNSSSSRAAWRRWARSALLPFMSRLLLASSAFSSETFRSAEFDRARMRVAERGDGVWHFEAELTRSAWFAAVYPSRCTSTYRYEHVISTAVSGLTYPPSAWPKNAKASKSNEDCKTGSPSTEFYSLQSYRPVVFPNSSRRPLWGTGLVYAGCREKRAIRQRPS